MSKDTCKEVGTYRVEIFIGGDHQQAIHICRRFCEVGLCVTVCKTEFVYTGGQETGIRIGLLNYPRFPSEPEKLWATAINLAKELKRDLYQDSVLVCDTTKTLWLTRRST